MSRFIQIATSARFQLVANRINLERSTVFPELLHPDTSSGGTGPGEVMTSSKRS